MSDKTTHFEEGLALASKTLDEMGLVDDLRVRAPLDKAGCVIVFSDGSQSDVFRGFPPRQHIAWLRWRRKVAS